jgi:hypothetical protein
MSKKKGGKSLQFLPSLLGWGGVATTGLALFLYACLGTFSRYYADDFCMSGFVVKYGFWPAQWIQYTTWSNRFAGMLTLTLSDFLGRFFIRLWPALTLLLWVLGLAWALNQAARLLRFSVPKWLPLLVAEWIVFISALLAPDLYQSLFWRVGAITYTLPLALLAGLCGLVIEAYLRAASGRRAWGWMVGAGLLAFFAGGFSETALALQTTLLAGSLLVILLYRPAGAWRGGAGWAVGAALIGSLVAMLAVLLAPGNAVRQAAMPAHPGLLALAKMDVISAFLFVYISMKSNAFQFLLAILGPLFIVYGCFAVARNTARLRPSPLVLGLFLAPLIGFLSIAAVMAPASYAQSAYPDGRVLIVASFALTLMLVAEGILMGTILSQLHQWAEDAMPAFLQALTALLALAILCYPLYDTYKSIRLIPAFQTSAQAWDARDARIRQARLDGESQIVAVSLEAPAGMSELQVDPANWVNVCMDMFYGMDSITATP